jgi:hypothetical protein
MSHFSIFHLLGAYALGVIVVMSIYGYFTYWRKGAAA